MKVSTPRQEHHAATRPNMASCYHINQCGESEYDTDGDQKPDINYIGRAIKLLYTNSPFLLIPLLMLFLKYQPIPHELEVHVQFP